MKKEKCKKRKGVAALIVVILFLTVVFGGGMGALATAEAIALRTTHKGKTSNEIFDETLQYTDPSNFVTLEKEPDKDFVILNISDTHLGDYDYRLLTGELALRDIKRMVEEIKPDLITLSGDLVCGESQYNSIHKLTNFMNELKIPWAPIFGNHDGEASNIDKEYLADVFIGKKGDKNNYCLMRKGPSNLGGEDDRGGRVGNYVINIVEKGTRKLAQSIIMMDSGRDQPTEKQVLWYEQNVRTLQAVYGAKGPVKSTLILHIPLAQHYFAYMEGYIERTGEWRADYRLSGAYGDCEEDVCCYKKKFGSLAEMAESEEYKALPEEYRVKAYQNYFKKNGVPIENGLFAAIKKYGCTENVLCGHDHLNCFYAPYRGVNLIYSLKNGMGSGYKVGKSGGTVLTVSDTTVKVDHFYL